MKKSRYHICGKIVYIMSETRLLWPSLGFVLIESSVLCTHTTIYIL